MLAYQSCRAQHVIVHCLANFGRTVALAGALGGCAAISGLSDYTSGECTSECDAGKADGKRDTGGPPGVDATVGSDAGRPDSGDARAADAAEGGCAVGLIACDGGCVDPTSASSCGACDNVCAASAPLCTSADGGYACAMSCPPASPTQCEGTCVDTTADPDHCSSCTNACPTSVAHAQPACASSACTFVCAAGYSLCGGACVDEQTDSANCGGCGSGHACSGGASCQAGVCCTPITLPPSVNVDATQWAASFATSPTWNCNAAGTTTVDSTQGTVTGDNCGGTATADLTNNVTQSGGPNVMVVRLKGLTVSNNHVLKLTGDKPIVFLVAGNVLVDLGGKIDAGARWNDRRARREPRGELRRVDGQATRAHRIRALAAAASARPAERASRRATATAAQAAP